MTRFSTSSQAIDNLDHGVLNLMKGKDNLNHEVFNLVKGIDNLDDEVAYLVKIGRKADRVSPAVTFDIDIPDIHSPIMIKAFSAIFISVFLAEIGDKTQLATMLFASEAKVSKWVIFAGSALALTLAAGIGVLVGAQLEKFVSPKTLKIVAGIGFIAIGLWTALSR